MEYTPNDFFEARKRTIDATYGRLEKSESVETEKKDIVSLEKSETIEELEPTQAEMEKADAEYELEKSIDLITAPFDFNI